MKFDDKAIDKAVEQLKFDDKGLIPVVAQDFKSGDVLMMAWADEEAVRMSLKSGYAHYFSRSRGRIWKKGESSKQVQKLQEFLIDCDGDCVVVKVEQEGVACHTGRKSCFFKTITNDGVVENQKVIIPPEELYGKKSDE